MENEDRVAEALRGDVSTMSPPEATGLVVDDHTTAAHQYNTRVGGALRYDWYGNQNVPANHEQERDARIRSALDENYRAHADDRFFDLVTMVAGRIGKEVTDYYKEDTVFVKTKVDEITAGRPTLEAYKTFVDSKLYSAIRQAYQFAKSAVGSDAIPTLNDWIFRTDEEDEVRESFLMMISAMLSTSHRKDARRTVTQRSNNVETTDEVKIAEDFAEKLFERYGGGAYGRSRSVRIPSRTAASAAGVPNYLYDLAS